MTGSGHRACVNPRMVMSNPLHHIGMLTGGGDAPGLHAVIRGCQNRRTHPGRCATSARDAATMTASDVSGAGNGRLAEAR
jgi:hypothetical protein